MSTDERDPDELLDARLRRAGERWRASTTQETHPDFAAITAADGPAAADAPAAAQVPAVGDEVITITPGPAPERPKRRGRLTLATITGLAAAAVATVLVIQLGGTNGTNQPAAGTGTPLVGTTWQLTAYTSPASCAGDCGPASPLASGATDVLGSGTVSANPAATPAIEPPGAMDVSTIAASVTLRFDGKGRMSGSDGRAPFSGPVQLRATTIDIGEIGVGGIGGTGGNPALEAMITAVEAVLQPTGTVSWSIDGDRLTLTRDGVGRLEYRAVNTDPEALTGIDWQLSGLYGPDGSPLPVVAAAALRFDGRSVSGTDACNHLGGGVTVSDGTIDFDQLATTEMGCLDRPAGFDDEVALIHAVLNGTARWSVIGDQLSVGQPGVGELIYTAEPKATVTTDPKTLVATRWTLTTVTSGDGPDGTASTAPAGSGLTFDGVESMTIDFGCSSTSSADVTVAAGTIAIQQYGWTEPGSCDGSAIHAVLQGTVEWSIKGSTLTITRDGVGSLVFSAADIDPGFTGRSGSGVAPSATSSTASATVTGGGTP